jgi:zinc transporter, ZIP family
MSQLNAVLLGAAAGATIFAGLPVARMGWLPRPVQGFLNAAAAGILVFLLWDILSHAAQPVSAALAGLHRGSPGQFLILAGLFAAGIGVGLLALVHLNGWLGRVLSSPQGPSAVVPPRTLSMMLATGLGLHNLSEGLAIGQSAATGAVAFAGVLVIGFALHNVTEGFGIAAPLTLDRGRASWGFLLVAGLIGGGPTFLGTIIGYRATSTYVYVLFLALAAGALLYVLNELFNLGRRISTPTTFAWGLLLGFLTAYATDLFLTAAGG